MRKDLVAHGGQHFVCTKVPKLRPAQMLLIFLETACEGLAAAFLAVFISCLVDVEKARIHQEGDLLDHRQGVRDPALPEFCPERIDAPF